MIKRRHSQSFMMAEVGKIKIGKKGAEKKSKAGNSYYQPERLKEFIVTTTEKGEDKNFLPDTQVMKALSPDGKPLKEIPIKLMFDDIDLNFRTAYAWYSGKKRVCTGDGEKARWWVKGENGEPVLKDRVCAPEARHGVDACPQYLDKSCKISGVLSCMIIASVSMGGVYRFRTHGWNSVNGILGVLEYIKENTGGVLQGLPFRLKFLQKNTADYGDVPVVTLVLDGAEIWEMRKLAMAEKNNRLELGVSIEQIEEQARASGFEEDTDTPEDIEAEFYHGPESDQTPPPKGASASDLKESLKASAETAEDVEPVESALPVAPAAHPADPAASPQAQADTPQASPPDQGPPHAQQRELGPGDVPF